MKIANQIRLSVFSKEEDDGELVRCTFLSLFPFDLAKEKIEVCQTTAQGFSDRKIRIMEASLVRAKHISGFLDSFFGRFSDEQLGMLISQLDSRIDESTNFYIRLDKDKLMSQQTMLTDCGNCFHIRIAVAAYPAKKEIAKKIMEDYLTEFRKKKQES